MEDELQVGIPTFEEMGVSADILDGKLLEFSTLELSGQDPHKALKTMLLNERVKVPKWLIFFSLYGITKFRRDVIEAEDI